jgi:hypothetical protein
MVDFDNQTRKRCRHCKMDLPTPTSNAREAFCTRGCYSSFYRKRCLICEEAFVRKNEGQKLCGKRKCRNALRQLQTADFPLGRYYPRPTSSGGVETPINKGSAVAVADPRPTGQTVTFDGSPLDCCAACGQGHDLVDHKTVAGAWITLCCGCRDKHQDSDLVAVELVPAQGEPWLPKGLAKALPNGKPGWQWRRMSETSLDDDWELFDRDGGKRAARIRQEGDGYWVARPRMIPEPPIESFKAACRRAVNVAMWALDWPESERHPVHPGMTALQFDATKRDLARKHPDWSTKEIYDHIVGILKPSTRQDGCLIKRNDPPVNILGGYKFPAAPVIDLSSIEPKSQAVTLKLAASRPDLAIPAELSIPPFLDRRPLPLQRAA